MKQRPTVGDFPNVPSVQPDKIPVALKGERRWITWRAGQIKANGKFPKYPTAATTGWKINPHDEANWVTFEEALEAHRIGEAHGIGFVLSDKHPIKVDGETYFLTAIDLDDVIPRAHEAKELWLKLGKPYVEMSPSGKGMRMLCLSTTPAHVGNAGGGREMYARGQYVTITGIGAKGALRDCTEPLAQVCRAWQKNNDQTVEPREATSHQKMPETEEYLASVQAMLNHLSSDIPYDDWRNIIWAVTSTGWGCIHEMLHDWSRTTPDKYDAAVLDNLIQSFDPTRGITLGTLVHHARTQGWSGSLPTEVGTEGAYESGGNELRLRPQQSINLLSAQDVKDLPASPYRVRGLLPARGVAAIFGAPGSGKTFLSMDLAAAIAEGREEWFGFKIKQAPVVYVALEGQGGFRKRIVALETEQGRHLTPEVQFCFGGLNLLTGQGADELAHVARETLGNGLVVFVDTLNQASPGGDENSSEAMGAVIANAQRLAYGVDGLVVLVHHSGKDQSKGLRGHSSLLAAMDTVIEVRADQGVRQWCLTKAKDEDAGHTRSFQLKSYEVGQDEDGSPVTSCAVSTFMDLTTPTPPPPSGKNQKAAMAELRRLQAAGSSLSRDEAISRVAAVLLGNRSRERAKDSLQALLRSRHLMIEEGGKIAVC